LDDPRSGQTGEGAISDLFEGSCDPPDHSAEIGAFTSGANDYGGLMSEAAERPMDRPCEDCGAFGVAGLEPIDPALEDPDVVATGVTMVGSEWCTNLDCPSNHAVRGLKRVGVSRYICKVCGEELTGPTSAIFAHRRTH